MKLERVQKVIANSGFCSRRRAEKLILAGRVQVNDKVIKILGTKCAHSAEIKIDNKIINSQKSFLYIMLNKPQNVISSNFDPKHRKILKDYLPEIKTRVYSIGRLDYDASGLILLTNDGRFANMILHPKFEVDKKYQVLIKGPLTEKQKQKLENGIFIEAHFLTSPAVVKVLEYNRIKNETTLNLTIHEGRNHQIKKMMIAINSRVLALKRIKIGSLKLDRNLNPGQYRFLTKKEIHNLIVSTNGD